MIDAKQMSISTPERVLRILQKMCSVKLQVFIRTSDSNISVRGLATSIETVKKDFKTIVVGLRIGGLSEKAIAHLYGKDIVRIEFVMLSTKITFKTRIKKLRQGFVIVSMPKTLVSIERRKNARYLLENGITAYAYFSSAKSLNTEHLVRPSFPHHNWMKEALILADISVSGICVHSYFPFFCDTLVADYRDIKMKLQLPLQDVFIVPTIIRWQKKLTEHIKSSETAHIQTTYRLGCEFIDLDPQGESKIRRLIQQISEQGSI